ncbi:CopD family protein [Vulgatibacter incomptus]|uniref:Uncharacterized protein n=1 Tax=Vulgatibacter incomptus TaxID=1391653 RepID=A0A0K1PA48_9BACT|nr:CopD family protein [Vulgatibacter incomptus]AKU89994.1 hypothetical protein AKJ08_0381 [Vulgatibacter incomptus]
MFALLKLLHIFGFIAWFSGLLGTTAAQVAVRKAQSAEGRQAAWSVMNRLVPNEIFGMILTPLAGIALTVHAGMGKLGFVHTKMLLVLIAVVFNVLVIVARKKAAPRIAEGGPELGSALKRMAMFQGIATLMLPAAVVVVMLLR